MQFKYALSYISIIIGLLILMNTYPMAVSRDLIFSSKQSSLQGQALVVASSLSNLDVVKTDSVKQTINTLDITGLTQIIITDADGLVVYDTGENPTVGNLAENSEISTALNGKDIFRSKYSQGVFKSYAASPIFYNSEVNGAVYIYEYDSEQGGLLQGIQTNLGNISLVIAAGSVLIAFVFSQTMTRRIKAMLRAIKIVSSGNYSYKLTTVGSDELAELSCEFNNLTDRLQKTEEVRRRFVSDASHELKTPLASIRLLSDSVVQNKEMEPALVREFVQDIGHEADRLARTTEKLLSLTRLDGEAAIETAAVDLKKVAENALHMLAPLADTQEVLLDFNLEEGSIIRSTEDDAHQIIFNLAENGIKYNVKGGTLRVLLHKTADKVCMIFEDTGIGIPEADIPHIFDRFYRVEKARSSEMGGSGLGLSIVKDTVLQHNGEIEVAKGKSGGTRFTVIFPIYADGN